MNSEHMALPEQFPPAPASHWIGRLAVMALLLLGITASCPAADLLPRGHVFFKDGFEAADALKAWQGWGEIAPLSRGKVLKVTWGPSDNGVSTITTSLPVEQMRGYTVYCRAGIRGLNISQRPNPWNGIKFMLMVDTPLGRQWPAASIPIGTFDWQEFSFAARIPADATAVKLVLGLELVTGTAWFDDVRVVVGKQPIPDLSPAPDDQPIYTGHALPRLRGTMISPDITPDSLRTLGQEWNANLIRWQFIRTGLKPGQAPALESFDPWLASQMKRLDAALPLCEKYGLMIVLDLHSPPGGSATVSGYQGSDTGLFQSKAAQDKFVESWQLMARRYKGRKIIWGFDLANEPVEGTIADDCDDWHALATRAAKAINAIDPQRTIIVEPPDWGGPQGLKEFYPIDAKNVVYSVHMYIPGTFTHQGVHGPSAPVVYPGQIDGRQWDKAALEQALSPAIAFQKKYRVHIYIGEFSAIRWAPDHSAYRYLRDCIDIFEAHGWDWSYHAFREWSGWSVEYTGDRSDNSPARQPTDREQLLRQWFAKNQKPK